MKKIIVPLFLLLISFFSAYSLALPTYYHGLEIKDIEISPSPASTTHGYTVHLKENLSGTGCGYPGSISIKSGSFHDEALSVLLAAMMGDKKIFLRIYKCTDRPVADRVGIVK